MKVLVTGARGTVGRAITNGWEGVEVVPYDIADGDDLFDAAKLAERVAGVDAVLHLAAYPHRASAPDWETFKRLNVDGTKAVFAAAAEAGIGRFVYMSSGNVYCFGDGIGDQDERQPPIGVDDHPPAAECHPYPRSKLVAEAWLKRNASKVSCVVVLRPNHFAPTPPDVMALWRGTTITMDRLVRYARNACTRPVAKKFVILDVIEPTDNYPASIEAKELLD